MDIILRPFHIVISKPARRAYIQTILLILASISLLFVAVASYLIFYAHYIPTIGIEKPIHFNYAPPANPTGAVDFISSELIGGQSYAITLHLRLPTSPINIAHGNFNCDLAISRTSSSSSIPSSIIFQTRRPGIMTYSTPLLTTLKTLLASPLLVTGLTRQEETLHIVLAEAAVFAHAPRSATLALDPGLSVYSAHLEFRATFTGLRRVMYEWQFMSFVVFTMVFWATEIGWAVFVWYWISTWLVVRKRSKEENEREEEEEEEEESRREEMNDDEEDGDKDGDEEDEEEELRFGDVQRTFPTSSRAPALRPSYPTPETTPAPEGLGGEWTPESDGSRVGDDEDEDDSGRMTSTGRATDSGLGTTMSEGTGRDSTDNMRRRIARR